LFYSSVPAEVVTIAVLNQVSVHSLCCLMNRKIKSYKQPVFLSEQCGVRSYKKCSQCSLSALTQAHN